MIEFFLIDILIVNVYSWWRTSLEHALHERRIQVLNEGLDEAHFFAGIFKDRPEKEKTENGRVGEGKNKK